MHIENDSEEPDCAQLTTVLSIRFDYCCSGQISFTEHPIGMTWNSVAQQGILSINTNKINCL